jgi:hypothetical protein
MAATPEQNSQFWRGNVTVVIQTMQGGERGRPSDNVDVLDPSGKTLYFSVRTFVDEIADGEVCFICGASPIKVPFNDEHVIPDWILSAYDLHSRNITIPNKAQQMYGRYKIPCCVECNSQMAELFESPISVLVKGGYATVREHIEKDGPWLIFKWLALIYLKTHLKDRELRLYLDRRRGSERVSHLYEWEHLHHVHCIARSFHTGVEIDNAVLGTVLLWQAELAPGQEPFDYGDSYPGRTIMLRLGDVAIIAVLNDSGAVGVALEKVFRRMPRSMSPLQLRELMTRMAYTNMSLTERARFHSSFSGLTMAPPDSNKRLFVGEYKIVAERMEKFFVREPDYGELGEMLVFNLRGPISEITPPEEREALIELMRDGRRSFIPLAPENPVGEPVPVQE